MKKLALMIVAATAFFAAAPASTPASAQTVVIGGGARQYDGYRSDGYRDRGRRFDSRAQYRRDRAYRRGYDRGPRRGGPAIVIRP